MTNAAKHGALAGGSGQVTVTWNLDEVGNLVLSWKEKGGASVIAPTRLGFGSAIIQSIPHKLGGMATIDYAPTGLHAHFLVPSRFVICDNDASAGPVSVQLEETPQRLTGTVMMVEDNVIIALEAEDMLIALAAENALVASSVADALRLLSIETPTFALLDVNLGIDTSWPIASRLRELGVHYVFATGYGDGIEPPLEHRHAPVITKPYTEESIAHEIASASSA